MKINSLFSSLYIVYLTIIILEVRLSSINLYCGLQPSEILLSQCLHIHFFNHIQTFGSLKLHFSYPNASKSKKIYTVKRK